MVKYKCGKGHEKVLKGFAIFVFCEDCREEMTVVESTGFTPYWYRLPSTGEVQPPPQTPEGWVAVQYRDVGYHGGEYWAVLPANWTAPQAVQMFLEEEHLNELVEIDHKLVEGIS